MNKYLLLYIGGSMPETEADQAAVIQAWTDWYTGLGQAVVDPGNPFTPVAKSVSMDGMVKNGPAGSMASGYTILQAGSIDGCQNGTELPGIARWG
jgi:hypothetical protein